MQHSPRSEPERRAGVLDRRVFACCEQLYRGAVGGQDYRAAWRTLAELFRACSVQLRRNVQLQVENLTPASPAVVFDRATRDEVLLQSLVRSGTNHGICGLIGSGPLGSHILLVLRKSPPFEAEEVAWMQLLAGHVGAALGLGMRLSSAVPTVAAAVQLARRFPLPCILLDDAGECLTGNEAFGEVFGDMSGVMRSGQVRFDEPSFQQAWEQALVDTRGTGACQSFVANAPNGTRWRVHVVPLASVANYAQETPRRLFLSAFERMDEAEQTADLSATSRLTKAEGEVLRMLLVGQTAKAIARRRGASVNTVRSQITAILAKTGHHTQKQLIASVRGASMGTAITGPLSDLH